MFAKPGNFRARREIFWLSARISARLAASLPSSAPRKIHGIDVIENVGASFIDDRATYHRGSIERCDQPDDRFDLVFATTSAARPPRARAEKMRPVIYPLGGERIFVVWLAAESACARGSPTRVAGSSRTPPSNSPS